MIEIGSSDAPHILGVGRLTPWQLWAEKVGLIKREDDPDEVMKSGKRLEDYVLDMELEEFGPAATSYPDSVFRQDTRHHLARKWQRATPDATDGGVNLYEVKCLVGQPPPSPRVADVVQCLHQLLVFEGAESNRLIYFGGLRRERFIVPRHQGALDRVLRAEEEFLGLVEKEIPPPVRAEDSPGLWRGWPLVRDECVTLPAEANAWDLAMVEAGRKMDDARERYEYARAQIKAAMGEHIRGVLPDGSVKYTWAPNKLGIRGLRRKERANGESGKGQGGSGAREA